MGCKGPRHLRPQKSPGNEKSPRFVRSEGSLLRPTTRRFAPVTVRGALSVLEPGHQGPDEGTNPSPSDLDRNSSFLDSGSHPGTRWGLFGACAAASSSPLRFRGLDRSPDCPFPAGSLLRPPEGARIRCGSGTEVPILLRRLHLEVPEGSSREGRQPSRLLMFGPEGLPTRRRCSSDSAPGGAPSFGGRQCTPDENRLSPCFLVSLLILRGPPWEPPDQPCDVGDMGGTAWAGTPG